MADCLAGARWVVQSGDRRAALSQSTHSRVAPEKGVHQTGDQVPHGTARHPAGPRPRLPARIAEAGAPGSDQGTYGRDRRPARDRLWVRLLPPAARRRSKVPDRAVLEVVMSNDYDVI